MAGAVKREAFEEAAKIRDQVKELQREMEEKKKG
ncbi:UvrB/UvrC motif-containing protein [bacterium]|nr:UvrB/UvrC motif-containing protein [bacterium]